MRKAVPARTGRWRKVRRTPPKEGDLRADLAHFPARRSTPRAELFSAPGRVETARITILAQGGSLWAQGGSLSSTAQHVCNRVAPGSTPQREARRSQGAARKQIAARRAVRQLEPFPITKQVHGVVAN